jgi:hypothetical protein
MPVLRANCRAKCGPASRRQNPQCLFFVPDFRSWALLDMPVRSPDVCFEG